VVTAPVYYDYQSAASFELSDSDRLEVLGFGARDDLRFLFSQPSASDPSLRGDVGVTVNFHRIMTRLESKLSPAVEQSIQVAAGTTSWDQHFGPDQQAFDAREMSGRAEWSALLLRGARLYFGLDAVAWWFRGGYDGPRPVASEGSPEVNEPSAGQRR